MKSLLCSLLLSSVLLLLSSCCWNGHLKKCTICPNANETPKDPQFIDEPIDFDEHS